MIDVTAATAGKVLAGLHRALGLSQRQFARQISEALGKNFDGTKAQLWTWESGTRQPDLSSLESALDVLGFKLVVVPKTDPDEAAHKGNHGVPDMLADPGPQVGPTYAEMRREAKGRAHHGAPDAAHDERARQRDRERVERDV